MGQGHSRRMIDLQTISDRKLTNEEIEFFVKHNASVRKRTAFEILEAAINYNNYSIFSNIEPIPIASLNVICKCLFGVEYLDPNALYTVRDELSNNIVPVKILSQNAETAGVQYKDDADCIFYVSKSKLRKIGTST